MLQMKPKPKNYFRKKLDNIMTWSAATSGPNMYARLNSVVNSISSNEKNSSRKTNISSKSVKFVN